MLEDLIQAIPTIKSELYRGSKLYKLIEDQILIDAEHYFGKNSHNKIDFKGVGEIQLPFFSMGNINTTHLFGLDELILFAFYMVNKAKYNRVADIGANVGLHSMVLAKIGYSVSAYEPDPVHCEQFLANLKLNEVSENVELFHNAVSNKVCEVSFTRVKGNTTGNHISGTRNPYGETDEFTVKTAQFSDVLAQNQLVKADVEGHEAVLINSTRAQDWDNTDAIFEVGSEENAQEIFDHLKKIEISIFTQKNGWKKANSVLDMPTSHREGSIFITKKIEMIW